jgi:colicin import membrane protein
MHTDTEIITPEILPPDNKLVQYAAKTGLEKQSTATLVEAFRPIFVKSREAIAAAAGVAESVKDATCVKEIKKSRACRLALRSVRLESDAVRKKQKEHALLYGRAVDGFHNILLADLSPVETALQEAEDVAERAEAARLAGLKATREAELVPFLDEPLLGNLADLSEADYVKKLANAKLLRQAKLDAAAKLEAEAKAKAEAERKERERLDAENAKLKAEAVAREAAAKAEREAAEKKLAEERAESARVAAEIKAKADAAAKAAAEKAARERAESEAKLKAEAERVAKASRIEREKIEAESAKAHAELAARQKAEAVAAEKAEAERKSAAAAAKKAAAAPDNAKLKAFAETVRTLERPILSDKTKQAALNAAVMRLATWAEVAAGEELL